MKFCWNLVVEVDFICLWGSCTLVMGCIETFGGAVLLMVVVYGWIFTLNYGGENTKLYILLSSNILVEKWDELENFHWSLKEFNEKLLMWETFPVYCGRGLKSKKFPEVWSSIETSDEKVFKKRLRLGYSAWRVKQIEVEIPPTLMLYIVGNI